MNENQFIHEKLYPKECWHEWTAKDDPKYRNRICKKCKVSIEKRTYDKPDYFTMPVEKLIARLVGLGWERNFGEYLRRQGMAVRIQSSTTVQPDTYFFRFDLISQPRFTTLLYNYLQKGE